MSRWPCGLDDYPMVPVREGRDENGRWFMVVSTGSSSRKPDPRDEKGERR